MKLFPLKNKGYFDRLISLCIRRRIHRLQITKNAYKKAKGTTPRQVSHGENMVKSNGRQWVSEGETLFYL